MHQLQNPENLPMSIPFVGRYVIQSDVLQRSDVIIGLMGSVPERSIHAADLYRQGIATRIILVEDDREPWQPLLSKGVHIDSEAEQFKDVCIQLGVPADSILILPGSAKSTRDEVGKVVERPRENPAGFL